MEEETLNQKHEENDTEFYILLGNLESGAHEMVMAMRRMFEEDKERRDVAVQRTCKRGLIPSLCESEPREYYPILATRRVDCCNKLMDMSKRMRKRKKYKEDWSEMDMEILEKRMRSVEVTERRGVFLTDECFLQCKSAVDCWYIRGYLSQKQAALLRSLLGFRWGVNAKTEDVVNKHPYTSNHKIFYVNSCVSHNVKKTRLPDQNNEILRRTLCMDDTLFHELVIEHAGKRRRELHVLNEDELEDDKLAVLNRFKDKELEEFCECKLKLMREKKPARLRMITRKESTMLSAAITYDRNSLHEVRMNHETIKRMIEKKGFDTSKDNVTEASRSRAQALSMYKDLEMLTIAVVMKDFEKTSEEVGREEWERYENLGIKSYGPEIKHLIMWHLGQGNEVTLIMEEVQ